MWPPTLRAQIHDRWELLEYLARDRILQERRDEAEADRDSLDEQRADARAALHS